VSILRVDDFDQGLALPELHLGARTSRTSPLDAIGRQASVSLVFVTRRAVAH
jgi:hypothetical protein